MPLQDTLPLKFTIPRVFRITVSRITIQTKPKHLKPMFNIFRSLTALTSPIPTFAIHAVLHTPMFATAYSSPLTLFIPFNLLRLYSLSLRQRYPYNSHEPNNTRYHVL